MGYLVTKCTQNNSSLPDPISIGSTAYRKINVTLFFAGFITFMTLYDVQPLLPVFTKEFAVSPADGSLPLSISASRKATIQTTTAASIRHTATLTN
jgi:YNFM family putative membrane transporter